MTPLSHPTTVEAGDGRAQGPLTVGIDIGTTSVKAVAVDGEGRVVRRARVPHPVLTPAADRLEHDAHLAWVEGPRSALAAVAPDGEAPCVAMAVSAMTPTMAAVDGTGTPIGTGLLYDDLRGRCGTGWVGSDPTASSEAATLLAWAATEVPEAAGYWPAQAVANCALGGAGVLDYASACSAGPLFDGKGWDEEVCAAAGVTPDVLPSVACFGAPIGTVDPARWSQRPSAGGGAVPGAGGGAVPGAGGPAVLGAGGVDAFCEQLVAGANAPGDVLIVCGSTLVVWANVNGWPQAPGLWTLPHLKGAMAVVGGASNAGGLFLDWVDRLLAPATGPPRPGAVPVWWPYVRGERVPLHDPLRRGALGGLDITAGPAEVRRAAREASGFVARHILEIAGVTPQRVVVSGGGVRDRAWMQALADVLQVPVRPVGVPEGAALGAAWLARMAVGLETSIDDAGRWASEGRPVEPDETWTGPTADRYLCYRSGIAAGGGLRVR